MRVNLAAARAVAGRSTGTVRSSYAKTIKVSRDVPANAVAGGVPVTRPVVSTFALRVSLELHTTWRPESVVPNFDLSTSDNPTEP